jgi:hypothetical protein
VKEFVTSVDYERATHTKQTTGADTQVKEFVTTVDYERAATHTKQTTGTDTQQVKAFVLLCSHYLIQVSRYQWMMLWRKFPKDDDPIHMEAMAPLSGDRMEEGPVTKVPWAQRPATAQPTNGDQRTDGLK